jgi:hypothetical protein
MEKKRKSQALVQLQFWSWAKIRFFFFSKNGAKAKLNSFFLEDFAITLESELKLRFELKFSWAQIQTWTQIFL